MMQTRALIVDDETPEVLESVAGERAPAMDYLLKPFCRERFQESRQRVRHGFAERGAPDRMVVKCGDRLLFVPFDELDFIRASANYVRLHLGRTVYSVRETIAAMESNLPADRFVRIHRSYIVNLSAIRELYHAGGGEYLIALRSGRQLPVGSTYPPVIHRALCTAGLPRFGSIGGI
jgi:two-component system LytT family response regulator